MALTLEGASIGVDANGVTALINDINTQVVEETCSKLDSGLGDLRTAVDAVWVGKSAENFKANLETDANNIKQCINDTKEALVAELNEIVQRFNEIDETLVDKI